MVTALSGDFNPKQEFLDVLNLSGRFTPKPKPIVFPEAEPIPDREDPRIEARRREVREAERRRRGRRAVILTGGSGIPGEPPVARPGATAKLGE